MKVFPVFYFPPVSWFAALIREHSVVFEAHQHYRKQSYLNRTRIQGANKIQNLSIPIRRLGEETPIGLSEIDYNQDWQSDHWKGIESAYRSSPFFEYYEPLIEPFFHSKERFLMHHNLNIIAAMMDALKIKFSYNLTESYLPTEQWNHDYRNDFSGSGNPLASWFKPIAYPQVFRQFEPDLSILDLICNEGPGAGEILRKSFE